MEHRIVHEIVEGDDGIGFSLTVVEGNFSGDLQFRFRSDWMKFSRPATFDDLKKIRFYLNELISDVERILGA